MSEHLITLYGLRPAQWVWVLRTQDRTAFIDGEEAMSFLNSAKSMLRGKEIPVATDITPSEMDTVTGLFCHWAQRHATTMRDIEHRTRPSRINGSGTG